MVFSARCIPIWLKCAPLICAFVVQCAGRDYCDCEVHIDRVIIDSEQPSLFAVERSFAVTNRATGIRGVDQDWALGEVVARGEPDNKKLSLRFCRVYFEANKSVQDREKSTGARFQWDMDTVINV